MKKFKYMTRAENIRLTKFNTSYRKKYIKDHGKVNSVYTNLSKEERIEQADIIAKDLVKVILEYKKLSRLYVNDVIYRIWFKKFYITIFSVLTHIVHNLYIGYHDTGKYEKFSMELKKKYKIPINYNQYKIYMRAKVSYIVDEIDVKMNVYKRELDQYLDVIYYNIEYEDKLDYYLFNMFAIYIGIYKQLNKKIGKIIAIK